MRVAGRWSFTPEDAEDAYQRALEILLTKAPTTSEEVLLPWITTVVKREAMTVRRQNGRAPAAGSADELDSGGGEDAHDQAERLEQLRLGAEAMGRLKPQEVRALLLRAEGHSYSQIQDITGWTYTKVNRCLSEGRRAFARRLEGIEAGEECERLEPLLSLLADGEAGSDELAALRPHMKTCLTCRGRLRDFRAAPGRAAALLPPAALAAGAGGDPAGPLRSVFESALGATQDRMAALGDRAHQAAELATGQKVAAVAASAAVMAGGGGVAVEQMSERSGSNLVRERPALAEPVKEELLAPVVSPAPREEEQSASAAPTPPAPTAPAPKPAPRQAPRPASPAPEFSPEAAPAPARAAPAPTVGFERGAGGGSGGGGSGGGGEFGP